jgi:hypothetical protein
MYHYTSEAELVSIPPIAAYLNEVKARLDLISWWLWYSIKPITVLDIIRRPVFYLKTGRFGDWIPSPPESGTYSAGPNRKS